MRRESGPDHLRKGSALVVLFSVLLLGPLGLSQNRALLAPLLPRSTGLIQPRAVRRSMCAAPWIPVMMQHRCDGVVERGEVEERERRDAGTPQGLRSKLTVNFTMTCKTPLLP